MKNYFLLIISLFICSSVSYSQMQPDTAYIRINNERSEKITKALGIEDSAKFMRVQYSIAEQYVYLRKIYDKRDKQLRIVKSDTSYKETTRKIHIKNIENEAIAKIYSLHFSFITNLLIELNNQQIDKVKDEMTYNIAPKTYQAYIDMIPNLTNAQKFQIFAWLIEAREFAMDAESSEKKHEWFGKYKGRINNYLSKEGYDLKKESDEWQKRIKERESEKK